MLLLLVYYIHLFGLGPAHVSNVLGRTASGTTDSSSWLSDTGCSFVVSSCIHHVARFHRWRFSKVPAPSPGARLNRQPTRQACLGWLSSSLGLSGPAEKKILSPPSSSTARRPCVLVHCLRTGGNATRWKMPHSCNTSQSLGAASPMMIEYTEHFNICSRWRLRPC